MRRLLMGDKQIFQRRDATGEELRQVPLDDRKILRVAGLDQSGCSLASDQESGVIAVIDLAFVTLRQAIADPEHARRDLARQFPAPSPWLSVPRRDQRSAIPPRSCPVL